MRVFIRRRFNWQEKLLVRVCVIIPKTPISDDDDRRSESGFTVVQRAHLIPEYVHDGFKFNRRNSNIRGNF